MSSYNQASDGVSLVEQLIDVLPIPGIALSADGQVLAWNDHATELFGWHAGEVLGEVPPFVPPAETGRWREQLEHAGDDTGSPVRFRFRTTTGAMVRADVTMEPLEEGVDGEGPAPILVGIEDRTRFTELSHEVRLFDRVLRHNLRNDLNIVTGYAETLAEQVTDEQARSLALDIREHGREVLEVSNLARQLHDVFSGDRELDVVQLDELVGTVTARYESVATVTTDLDPVQVRAVPQVGMAVDHLLENAVEHTETTPPVVDVQVDTTVTAGEQWAEIIIADNGPGIPEEERAVLTKGAETALHHGSGLGLWLVYWVIEKSNGELQYAPNSPRGSIVTVRLLTAT